MAAVSQFATPERYRQIKDIFANIEIAKAELMLAQEAGIANADKQLEVLKQQEADLLKVFNTYFPNGTAPVGG